MSYQPLYARVTDNQGGRGHTLSLRGRVDQVGIWLNSWFGEVLNISAKLIDGRLLVKRPDLRKIKKDLRKQALADYEADVERENKVIVDIDIPAKQAFCIRINGIELGYERLKLMEDLKLRRMDNMIEALSKLKERDRCVLKAAEVVLRE